MLKRSILFGAILFATVALSACAKPTSNTNNTNSFGVVEEVTGIADIKIKEAADKNLAIANAKELWRAKFQMGEDLSVGPCLSNAVITDWVADIAHNPRTPVDDKPENQCAAYRNGTAHHFVELDPEGNLIRAQ